MSLDTDPPGFAAQDAVDLYRALRQALDVGVRRDAVSSALSAVLGGECGEVEAALILRRLAAKRGRRTAGKAAAR